MPAPRNCRIVYRRMERDDEYVARLAAAGVVAQFAWPAGAVLDALGDSNKLPRRIVEDVQP